MISVERPWGTHKNRSAIKTISFTPSGIFTNQVLDYLISDKLEGTTDGLIHDDTEESSEPIFLDVSCILGDYPAGFQVIDVTKRSAQAPCILPPFGYQCSHGFLEFLYTSDVTSTHIFLTTSLDHSILLRLMGPLLKMHAYLEQKKGHLIIARGRAIAFVQTCFGAKSNKERTINDGGEQILKCFFGPYLQNNVALDLLVIGVHKQLIEVCTFHSSIFNT